MTEVYLFYSSLTLFAMGCLTLILFILLRLRHHKMNSLPKNLSANIFNKTFNVLNPYPEHRKIIHSFLSTLPFIPFITSFVFIVFLLKMFESGLLLSTVIIIVCLNLMLIDVAAETHEDAGVLIEAVHGECDLGVGDVKAFQTVKKALPRLSNYYLVLAILFFAFAATLNYIWSSILWILTQIVGLILELSATTGVIAYPVAVFLFAIIIVSIQIIIVIIKNKFLRYVIEAPSFRD